MPVLIQQSTTADPLFFFLVLASDHISPATGKTPTVTISKNGAAFAAPSGAVTEISGGWYQVAGNATDTNTLGALLLHATEATSDNCDMEVAQIVAFNPRNANLGLTNVSSNVVQWNGTNVAAPATAGIPDVNVKNYNNQAATTDANNLPKVDTEDWKGAAVTALIGGMVPAVSSIRTGTAQAGAAGTITLDSGASATNGLYNDAVVWILSGTGAGQIRPIIGYAGATKVANVTPNWATNPDATSVFVLVPSAFADVVSWLETVVPAPATGGIPDVNVKNYNNVAAQTDANNLPKTDIEDIGGVAFSTHAAGMVPADLRDIAGAAVNTAAAQLGVNVVNIAGVAAAVDANNFLKVDVEDWKGAAAPAMPANFNLLSIDANGNVSVTSNIKKNTALPGFTFPMTDSTTHAPKSGLGAGVTGQRSLDGAAFGALTNPVSELTNGDYVVNLAAGDLNGNVVMLRFTAAGADDLNLLIITQR